MADKEMGIRLKEARTRKKKSQAEVCELADIPKVQTLSAYERGINSPPLETLKKLSVIYDVSADFLLFGREYTSKTAQNDKYCLSQLVYAVDTLQLPISMIDDEQSNSWGLMSRSYKIVIGGGTLHDGKQLSVFMDKWVRLRNARESGAIDWEDYDSIIAKRLEEVPDDISLSDIFEPLPF